MRQSNKMQDATRTVRFKRSELEKIDEFLEKNSFFDFSSLTRMAIQKFISEPQLTLIPVSPGQGYQKEQSRPED